MTKDEQWLLDEKYGGQETPVFKADCNRLALGEPVAYVIGWQPFLGLKISLDSKSLIPRPETEWWTDQMLANLEVRLPGSRTSKLKFLDLCAGSGAIGCAALARLPGAHVYFGEIDGVHEKSILKSIRENKLDRSRAAIRIGDLFEPFGNMRFDGIAINPPYIPTDRALPASVAKYEPLSALYSGASGLDLTRRIAEALPRYLTEGGQAWIECDSAYTEAACALFTGRGLSARLHADQCGVPRYIVVSLT